MDWTQIGESLLDMANNDVKGQGAILEEPGHLNGWSPTAAEDFGDEDFISGDPSDYLGECMEQKLEEVNDARNEELMESIIGQPPPKKEDVVKDEYPVKINLSRVKVEVETAWPDQPDLDPNEDPMDPEKREGVPDNECHICHKQFKGSKKDIRRHVREVSKDLQIHKTCTFK